MAGRQSKALFTPGEEPGLVVGMYVYIHVTVVQYIRASVLQCFNVLVLRESDAVHQ